MIITRLIGGLGNQFFQYAVGRYLAEKNQTILKLDISAFETYKLHKYSLWPFNIREKIASLGDIEALAGRRTGLIAKMKRQLIKIPTYPRTYVREKGLSFNPEILKLCGDFYIEGYWQSEKYFLGIETLVRHEFTVKNMSAGKDRERAQEIESCESVAVHIRRADYVTNPETNKVHGNCCDLNYYFRCAEMLSRTVKTPCFFIFSDDPMWVSENLKMPGRTIYVDHNNADKNYEDLRLMSLCRHNIIANSTFSWWGAWLNKNPDKIVFAPQRWFNNSHIITDDLIPDAWIKT